MTYNFNLIVTLTTGEILSTEEGFTIENHELGLSKNMISDYITSTMEMLFANKYILPPVDGVTADDGYLVLGTTILRARDIKKMHFNISALSDEEILDKEIL